MSLQKAPPSRTMCSSATYAGPLCRFREGPADVVRTSAPISLAVAESIFRFRGCRFSLGDSPERTPMFQTKYIRDGHGQIIGSQTENTETGDTIARDRDGKIVGHANERLGTTRDGDGRLVSRNTADTGLLFRS